MYQSAGCDYSVEYKLQRSPKPTAIVGEKQSSFTRYAFIVVNGQTTTSTFHKLV